MLSNTHGLLAAEDILLGMVVGTWRGAEFAILTGDGATAG